MTDAELKAAMQAIVKVSGLNLSDERIERDLPSYKSYLNAIARVREVTVPVEAEPASIVRLEPERR